MNLVLIQFLTLFYSVLCLDITLPQLRAYPYIENAVGVHNLTLTQRTPPTIQTTTWYILFNKGKEDQTTIGNGCPDNSSICAITKVDLNNGEDPIITEIFSLDEKYTTFDANSYGIFAYWEHKTWGDLNVNFGLDMICLDEHSSNKESLEFYDGSTGIDGYNTIRWTSKSFCNPNINNGGNGWGFLSTSFLVLIVALAGYLIAQAWFNTSTMGSSSDFFNELMDTVVENFGKIPQFIGEVIQKISGSNNNRGGYSAV